MNLLKKLVPLAIACAIFSGTGECAFPGISRDVYIRGYILGSENVPVYTDKRLKIQGTASPHKEYDSVLYPTTEIRIYEVQEGWAYVGYNTFWSGKREGYIPLSALTNLNYSLDGKRATSPIDNIYKRPNERYPNSAIYKGDTVYTLAKDKGYVQVIYPAAEVYKIAWIKENDYAVIEEKSSVKKGDNVSLKLNVLPITYENLFAMMPGEELPDISKDEQSLLVALAMKYSYQEGIPVTAPLVKSKELVQQAELFPNELKKLDFDYLSYHIPMRNSILNRILIYLAQDKPVIIGGKGKDGESYAIVTSYEGPRAGEYTTQSFAVYDPKTGNTKALSEWLIAYPVVTRIVF